MATGLFIAPDFKPRLGGIAEHNHQMAKHLTELGELIHLLTPALTGAMEFDQSCGYPVARYGPRVNVRNTLAARLARLATLPAILRIARKVNPHYLLCNPWDPISGISVLLASKLLDLPLLFFIHGEEITRRPCSRLRRLALMKAQRVFCVSNYTSTLAENIGVEPTRVSVVPNGFDFRQIAHYRRRRNALHSPQLNTILPPDAPTILTVCRLETYKGIDHVIQAMPHILATVPAARYVIVGSGTDRDRLKRLADASAASGSITFLGSLTDDEKFECYERCDIFAMLSRPRSDGSVEGFGIVYLEANAFGKPVIGGRCGGVPDAVLHGHTGLLVDPNDVGAIAEAATRLLTDRPFARRLGDNGRRRVQDQLNWTTSAHSFRTILRATLDS